VLNGPHFSYGLVALVERPVRYLLANPESLVSNLRPQGRRQVEWIREVSLTEYPRSRGSHGRAGVLAPGTVQFPGAGHPTEPWTVEARPPSNGGRRRARCIGCPGRGGKTILMARLVDRISSSARKRSAVKLFEVDQPTTLRLHAATATARKRRPVLLGFGLCRRRRACSGGADFVIEASWRFQGRRCAILGTDHVTKRTSSSNSVVQFRAKMGRPPSSGDQHVSGHKQRRSVPASCGCHRPGRRQVPVLGSYTSAALLPLPPATRTRPDGSSVAVCSNRWAAIELVAVHVPVSESYKLALATESPANHPPLTNTLPDGSSVALWDCPPVPVIDPVAVQVPVSGSYTSALARSSKVNPSYPPTTNTLPEGAASPSASTARSSSPPSPPRFR